ncbi:T9SS type A sorting domain-containing protein [bacterium]|nr:T9SS type A sorting domain-containing protein [bacterium]
MIHRVYLILTIMVFLLSLFCLGAKAIEISFHEASGKLNKFDSNTSFNNTIEILSPVAHIVRPARNTYTACFDQQIVMFLESPDGIEPSSIEFSVNGDRYDISTLELVYWNDSLFFNTPSSWMNGDTIEACLLAVEDTLGNPLSGEICWEFIVDLSAPRFSNQNPLPGAAIDNLTPVISVDITDEFAGVNPLDLLVEFEGNYYSVACSCVAWDGTSLEFDLGCIERTLEIGESVEVCVHASDTVSYCESNDTIYCWDFYVPSTGLVAYAWEPHPGAFSGCEGQPVILYLWSEVGVINESIELWIGRRSSADTYYITSPEIGYIDSFLIFTPEPAFTDAETIYVSLIGAEDHLGNTLEYPVSWEFTMDLSEPAIGSLHPSPGEAISNRTEIIRVEVEDAVSGLDETTLIFNINGTVFNIFNPAVSYIDGYASFNPSLIGAIYPRDTISVCLRVEDQVDYCEPHLLNFCWNFRIIYGGPVAELDSPEAGSYLCTSDEMIRVSLNDPDGIDSNTIVLSVNEDTFEIYDSELMFGASLLMFFPPPLYFDDADTCRVCLLSADDMLGNHLEGAPVCWNLYTDFSPPMIFQIPLASAPEDPLLGFVIIDALSGLETTSLGCWVDSVWYGLEHDALEWNMDSVLVLHLWDLPDMPYYDTINTVCVHAADLPGSCEPNEAVYCTSLTAGDSTGPEAAFIQPLPYTIYACEDIRVIMEITDDDGVDPTSILFEYAMIGCRDTMLFTVYDSELTFIDGILTLNLDPALYTDTVCVRLLEVEDILGNALEGEVSTIFYQDYEYPELLWAFPDAGETVDSSLEEIKMLIEDNVLIDTLSLAVILERTRFDWGIEPLYMRGDTLILLIPSSGVDLVPGDTMEICVEASDVADYCEPHELIRCWEFFISATGICDRPEIPGEFSIGTNYPNPFNARTSIPVFIDASQRSSIIGLFIYDIYGRLVADLTTQLAGYIEYKTHRSGVCDQNLVKTVVWEPRDCLSGVYFAKLRLDQWSFNRKVIYLK